MEAVIRFISIEFTCYFSETYEFSFANILTSFLYLDGSYLLQVSEGLTKGTSSKAYEKLGYIMHNVL